ncbi:unnamed protein product [Paramecium primaurelia]|uniref:Uncharacterized protein n=1 Tax=Paramecium primaurelia TaxID=5886 RepID=A0A8S1MDR1_PARPR|nr:unnamed protein product [Paramecium primaurelia]
MLINLLLVFIYFVNSKNIKANRNFKVPQITADYLVKCKNVFTYYLEQKNKIVLEEEFQAEKTEIDHISAADIQGIAEDKPIIFESPILLQSGPIRSTTLYNQFGFVQTWTILHHDDFENRNSMLGWNIPHRAYCELKGIHYTDVEGSPQNDHFIHEANCNVNNPSLQKTYNTNIEHNHIRVSAELTIFGDWNGDSINVLIDNKVAWSKVFQGEITQAEHPCPALFALGIPVQFTMEHKTHEFTISFQANHKRHPCDGSFGVDDIIVYYKQ